MNLSKMRHLAVLLLVVAVIALATALPGRTAAQGSTALLRFVHGVPGAPNVDVLVNGSVFTYNIPFGAATRFITVPAGDLQVSLVTAEEKTQLVNLTLSIGAGEAKTAVASGSSAVVVTAYEDDLAPTGFGKTRLRAIHAVEGAGAVDVIELPADGSEQPLFINVAYAEPFGAADVPAAAPKVAVVPTGGAAGQALVTVERLPLIAGTYNTVVVLGGASPQAVVLTTGLPSDDPAASGALRLVHGNVNAPAVDVYVNGTLIAPGINFGQATPHLALPAQALQVEIRLAGLAADTQPLASGQIDLSTVRAQTVVVAGSAEQPAFVATADNTATLDSTTARVHLINAVGSGEATLQFQPSTLTASSTAAAGTDIPAGTYTLIVSADGVSETAVVTLDGGVLYDVIIAGNAGAKRLIVAPTSLNETLGSSAQPQPEVIESPTSAPEVAMAPTLPPVPTVTEVPPTATAIPAEPTLSVAEQVQTAVAGSLTPVAGAAAQQPTQLPTVPPVVTQAPEVVVATAIPAVATGDKNLVTATVETNPGVNLKLREYPRDDARTLALAPSGAQLVVRGLKGPVVQPTQPVGEGTPRAPRLPTATLSSEGVTLEQTWVFVEWQQPDGSLITGWTKALYLKIVKDGKQLFEVRQLFTELPLIPEDTFGVVGATSATPIPLDAPIQDIGTVNVDEGVRLQVRRTPSTQGESLALLDNGTQVVVLLQTTVEPTGAPGEPKNNIWLFIQYTTASGSVTGWVNSDFILLSRRNRPLDIKEIPSTDQPPVGEVTGSIAPAATQAKPGLIATVDRIDPGANLQLRRTPTADGESLGLIPSGSQVPILGRNGDGNWLYVNFNGTEGWINAFFVTVTRNGRRVNIAEITNITDQPDIAASITPGPTPTPTVTQ